MIVFFLDVYKICLKQILFCMFLNSPFQSVFVKLHLFQTTNFMGNMKNVHTINGHFSVDHLLKIKSLDFSQVLPKIFSIFDLQYLQLALSFSFFKVVCYSVHPMLLWQFYRSLFFSLLISSICLATFLMLALLYNLFKSSFFLCSFHLYRG